MKPTKRDVIEWARTVWPGVFRGPDPLYNGYMEFAELAYAAGRKAGMEEAAKLLDCAADTAFTGSMLVWAEKYARDIRALIAQEEA